MTVQQYEIRREAKALLLASVLHETRVRRQRQREPGGRPCRPVVCLLTEREFPSVRAAAKVCGIIDSAVGDAIRRRRPVSAGYLFAYTDERYPIPILRGPLPRVAIRAMSKLGVPHADIARLFDSNVSRIEAVVQGERLRIEQAREERVA